MFSELGLDGNAYCVERSLVTLSIADATAFTGVNVTQIFTLLSFSLSFRLFNNTA